MTPDLWASFAAVVLGIVHISADSFSFKAQVGNAYTVGPRDEPMPRHGMAGRLHRAARNYTENVVLFLATVMLLRATNNTHMLGSGGAALWVVGRLLYLPAATASVSWVRTVCWQVSMVGLVAMLAAVVLHGAA